MPYCMKHICKVLVLSCGSECGAEGLLCWQISAIEKNFNIFSCLQFPDPQIFSGSIQYSNEVL